MRRRGEWDDLDWPRRGSKMIVGEGKSQGGLAGRVMVVMLEGVICSCWR